jgi:hypothetical protein
MVRQPPRSKKERNSIVGWWSAIVLLCLVAWQMGRLELWLLPLLVWSYYQLFAAPKLCGVETTKGHPCKNRAYGRLMACKHTPSHDTYKRDAFLQLLGFRRPARSIAAPAPYTRRSKRVVADMAPSALVVVEPKQQFFTILTIILTIIGTVAAVIQTMQGP